MARLSISNAARVTRVSRVTLHRYIKAGKLSRTPDGTIDTAELLRIGLTLHPDTVTEGVTVQRPVTSGDTLAVTPDTPALERLIEVLQQQVTDARTREQVAQEREALLLQMLQQVQQQNQRLLDAPRPPVVPVDAPRVPPRTMPAPTASPARVGDVTTPVPGYDPDTHSLGALCKRGHDWQGTGQSLRKKGNQRCLACDAAWARARRQTRAGSDNE